MSTMAKDPMTTIASGSVVELEAFQAILDQNNIESTLRNQFLEGLHAGVPQGVPNLMDLYVLEHDALKAKELFNQFQKSV